MIVSIIIITLNEADTLRQTILAARNATKSSSNYSIPIEIIVSDGGSKDGTIDIARELADKIIIAPKGRYIQLNEGAHASKGDVLLFLHSDTLLPIGGILRIASTLKDTTLIGGGFKKNWYWNPRIKRTSFIKFLGNFWEGLGNWLVDLFKTFPGDNAIFVRKKIFNELEGFAPLWICEDFDFSKRLKKCGKKHIAYIRSPVLTSARRFERYGFIKVLYMWFFIYFFWRFGMDAERLKVKFGKYLTLPERADKTILKF